MAGDNRTRRERLTYLLGNMLADAHYFVAGQRLEVAGSNPQSALDEAIEYLIENTFTKMGYLEFPHGNPSKEIQAVLRSDDIVPGKLGMDLPEGNPRAIGDLRSHIEISTTKSRQIVVHDIVTVRYARRPYGWPHMEVVLLLARMYAAGEVQFVAGGAPIPRDKLYEAITKPPRWRGITVVQRVTSKPEAVKEARALGREVFADMGPDGEDALFEFLKKKLQSWRDRLNQHRPLAETGNYPGGDAIEGGARLISALLTPDQSDKFLKRFNERRNDLLEFSTAFHDLEHFYENQRPMWEKLRAAWARLKLNQMELERDELAGPAMQRMAEILAAPAPYELVKEGEELITTASKVNEALLSKQRSEALEAIAEQIRSLGDEVAEAGGGDGLKSASLAPLQSLSEQIPTLESLAHIEQAKSEVVRLRDDALTEAEQLLAKHADEANVVADKPALKRRRLVAPGKLVKTTYLETQADVDAFLEDLGKELTDALSKNERIEIR